MDNNGMLQKLDEILQKRAEPTVFAPMQLGAKIILWLKDIMNEVNALARAYSKVVKLGNEPRGATGSIRTQQARARKEAHSAFVMAAVALAAKLGPDPYDKDGQ